MWHVPSAAEMSSARAPSKYSRFAIAVALLLDNTHLFAQWSPRAGKLLAAMKETSHA
jgi:hypothetical protein